MLSVFISIFEKIKPFTDDRFLACIYGGVLVGIGTALVLKASSSTGGTDLLTQIIRTFRPEFRPSSLIVIIDIIIVSINVFFFKEIEIGLYSAIIIYIVGKIIDVFFEGIDFTKMIYIVSDKYQEISDKINKEMNRGTTGLNSKGMYTDKESVMLLCVVPRNEVAIVMRIIKEVDEKAFIIISNTREVFGKGFKK